MREKWPRVMVQVAWRFGFNEGDVAHSRGAVAGPASVLVLVLVSSAAGCGGNGQKVPLAPRAAPSHEVAAGVARPVATNSGQGSMPPAEVTNGDQGGSGLSSRRPWLGVQMTDGPSDEPGVLVLAVVDDSPASKAGIVAQDRLLLIDEEPVNGPEQVTQLVASKRLGATCKISVARDGAFLELTVRLGAFPDERGLLRLQFNGMGPALPGNPTDSEQ